MMASFMGTTAGKGNKKPSSADICERTVIVNGSLITAHQCLLIDDFRNGLEIIRYGYRFYFYDTLVWRRATFTMGFDREQP